MGLSSVRGHHRRFFSQQIARILIAVLALPPAGPAAAPASPPQISPGSTATTPLIPPSDLSSCRESLASLRYPVVTTSRKELWPANHRRVDVGLGVDTGPACNGHASVGVVVWSDEPDDATGDGATVHDAQIDPPDLYLRAERQGSGDGRVYLIVATAAHQGVSSRGCAAVVVPRSQSGPHRQSVQEQARRAVEECGEGRVPSGYHRLVEGALSLANQAPVVDAGPDQGVELGSSAHLDGTVTDDGSL